MNCRKHINNVGNIFGKYGKSTYSYKEIATEAISYFTKLYNVEEDEIQLPKITCKTILKPNMEEVLLAPIKK